MLTMTDIAHLVEGQHSGENVLVEAVRTDSRTIDQGALFVALRGPRFDGHQFIDDVMARGARGVLVDTLSDSAIPQVLVSNTEQALGRLAAGWRSRFNIPIVAVTGSNGKTTVKEMVGCILRENAISLTSEGNLNNPVGLPLSLLELREAHRFAVVEIGMNQIGEIEKLAQIAKPTVAVITNAGAAHLENLLSIDQVAVEKGQIIAALDDDGTAILNADSPHYPTWRAIAAARKIVTFGLAGEADVSATFTAHEFQSKIKIKTSTAAFDLALQLPGEHNVLNALAAAAVGLALEIPCEQIQAGLESMRAVAGRLQLRQHFRGGRLIDDSYNANPNSVAAALFCLSKLGGDRRLVLGDMFELGDRGEEFHRDVGRLARSSGVGRLYALGELSTAAVQAFGRGARHYADRGALLQDLGSDLDATTTLLIKGSRGMKMDEIANFLCASEQHSSKARTC